MKIFAILLLLAIALRSNAAPPNVLFIAVDDLNDWVGCMGGHPQARTPNLDRLAASGVLFTNAHCAAPACNPSRTAVLTGISPHRSGLYQNNQKMREVLPDAELLPHVFSRHGYESAGSGKLLHYFIDARSWDDYFPEKSTENPFPRTLYPSHRPVSLPRGGPWQYVETDWGALDASDEEFGGDWLVSQWIGEQLSRSHAQPFFLACGLYRPHEPWFVPQKYFDLFPLDEIQLPPGYKTHDLDDLPPEGQRLGPNRYFAHIQNHGLWKKAIQGYLASIAFSDAMLGRVLDALEAGPNAKNTIVILWSDHGWHLGEKEHWQKFTLWRAATRVPLMVRVPAGVSGLVKGTTAGQICTQPVSLLDLFPTLLELCGLPGEATHDGRSLVPLLDNPTTPWPHPALTCLNGSGSYSLSDLHYRYIQYAGGGEELYFIDEDPYEWNNLANETEYAQKLEQFRKQAPPIFAPEQAPRDESLDHLIWQPARVGNVPFSRPEGGTFDVVFSNQRTEPVQLFWMDRNGLRKPYGTIPARGKRRQQTRPGAVWLIADASAQALGTFEVKDRSAQAVIPPEQ